MSEVISTQGWLVVVVAVGLICLLAGWDLTRRLWAYRKEEAKTPPYDYLQDDGLLNVWAREEEGELVTVYPADWEIRWRYK